MKFTIRNPLDEGWYADPEARYYEGKYIIYVTHSLPYDEQKNHSCFVSEDLTHWKKIENIIDVGKKCHLGSDNRRKGRKVLLHLRLE